MGYRAIDARPLRSKRRLRVYLLTRIIAFQLILLYICPVSASFRECALPIITLRV